MPCGPTRITYGTINGQAKSGQDYDATSGDLIIPSNGSEGWIYVPIRADDLCETDETFSIRLFNPTNGTLVDGSAVATILDNDCATPTLVTAFAAESQRDRIELRWKLADATTRVTVERAASDAGPWRAIAAETREESGTTIATDRDVVANAVYWYRLVARHADGSQSTYGPITATAAGAPVSFGLGSIRPNPSAGPTRIEFLVGHDANVRLSVSDIQGREVAVLADGLQSSGAHVAFWNGEGARGPLAGGLYFIRYLADGRSWTQRVVLAR